MGILVVGCQCKRMPCVKAGTLNGVPVEGSNGKHGLRGFLTLKFFMKTIAVYCGSSSGHDPAYIQAAKDVGKLLVDQGIDLVYGGGSVGMMGAVADAVLQGGGKVTGIIPTFLESKELGHHGVTELIVVETMHERKIKMFEMADGFIALPGGLGTMEELFEVLAWSQLAIHRHPCGLLNVRGYYDGLLQQQQMSMPVNRR